jgi:excisionase family DNA binding protein
MSTTEYLTPKQASKRFNVSQRTLLNWSYSGKIESVRTKGNHRRYIASSFIKEEQKDNRQKICYCRVSTASQKEDLERQIEYFRDKFPNHKIVKDIGSGINFKRKGFNTILDSAIRGNIEEVVVTHKDRLCRFGYELINRIIREHSNGKIMVLDQKKTSPEEELVNDLISIVTVFSSRLYGLRSHSIKKKIKEEALKKEEEENTTSSENIKI